MDPGLAKRAHPISGVGPCSGHVMKKDRGPDAAISSSEGGEVKVPSAIVAPARDKGEESRFLETRTKYFQFTGPLGESSGLPLCFGINKIILIRLVALSG